MMSSVADSDQLNRGFANVFTNTLTFMEGGDNAIHDQPSILYTFGQDNPSSTKQFQYLRRTDGCRTGALGHEVTRMTQVA